MAVPIAVVTAAGVGLLWLVPVVGGIVLVVGVFVAVRLFGDSVVRDERFQEREPRQSHGDPWRP